MLFYILLTLSKITGGIVHLVMLQGIIAHLFESRKEIWSLLLLDCLLLEFMCSCWRTTILMMKRMMMKKMVGFITGRAELLLCLS